MLYWHVMGMNAHPYGIYLPSSIWSLDSDGPRPEFARHVTSSFSQS